MLIIFPQTTQGDVTHSLYLDGEKLTLTEPIYVDQERLFVPVRIVSESLHSEVLWNGQERQVTIHSQHGDVLWFHIDDTKVHFNDQAYEMDVAPVIRNGRTYMPIRHVAELLHMKVKWESESRTVHLDSVPLHEVQEGESIQIISTNYGIDLDQLKERNQLTNDTLIQGQRIKVVLPWIMRNGTKDVDIMDTEKNSDEVMLLATLIFLEARDEPMEGKIGVGNVVMNRIAHSEFPNTLQEVIFQKGQYTPVSNGSIHSTQPDESAIEAAKRSLAGENHVGNAIFFFNPKHTNEFLSSRPLSVEIGNHRFLY
jgi:N-acetylmuramoyl-L-alanine amidase